MPRVADRPRFAPREHRAAFTHRVAFARIGRVALIAAIFFIESDANGQPQPAVKPSTARAELDRYVAGLGGDAALTDDDFVELSRLLPDALEQFDWLRQRAAMRADGGRTAEARALLEKTRAHLADWRARCAAADPADTEMKAWCAAHQTALSEMDADLADRIRRVAPSRLADVVDPAQLAAELNKRAAEIAGGGVRIDGLSSAEQLMLWSRGVPLALRLPAAPDLAGKDRKRDGWQTPARVAERVLAKLPTLASLPAWQTPLARAGEDLPAWRPAAPMPAAEESAYRQNAAALLRMGSALLNASVGIDGQDRAAFDADPKAAALAELLAGITDVKPSELGAARDDEPQIWESLAGKLGERNLWRMEALARLLQASTLRGGPTPNASAAAAVATQAIERLNRTVGVIQSIPGAPRQPIDGDLLRCLDQLAKGGSVMADSGDPLLAFEYRAAARQRRRAAETAFNEKLPGLRTADFGSNPTLFNDAFGLMQSAKAADAGLTADRPIALDALMNRFSDRGAPDIHLILEVLQIGNAWYGLAAGSQTPSLRVGNPWIVRFYEAKSPLELMTNAVPREWTGFTSLKVIVAPDGSMRTAAWRDGGEKTLSEKVDAGNRPSWLLYVPTVSVFTADSGWTMDRTLRLWAQSACAARRANGDAPRFAVRMDGALAMRYDVTYPGSILTNVTCFDLFTDRTASGASGGGTRFPDLKAEMKSPAAGGRALMAVAVQKPK